MSGLPFLVILIIGSVLVVSYLVSQNRTKAWKEAAQRLKFRFSGGGMMESRELRGMIDGVYAKAFEFTRSSGKNKSAYTGFRAEIKAELPRGLHLTKQGFFSGFAKFFGKQDIEIGDQSFDRKVIIQGRRPDEISAFLTPSRRIRILKLMQRYAECEIDRRHVYFALSGSESDPSVLVDHTRRVVDVARFLGEKPEQRHQLDEAFAHRERQAPESALERVRLVNQAEAPPDPEALELEGELLYLGGHYPEAADKFHQAHAAQPPNEELKAWATRCLQRETEAAPIESRKTAALQNETKEPPAPPPEPKQSPAPSSPLHGVDFAELSAALFKHSGSRFEATRHFESEYEGKSVSWNGTLQSVSEYTYDLVFKSGPGLIAHVELQKLENHPYGIRAVTAAIQLPNDAALKARLEDTHDQPLSFSGYLKKCDAFNGTVFVEAATII